MKGVNMYALAGGALAGLGSLAGAYMQTEAANKANKQQMDLAKNSIQYRVADAQKAGIHPLYALGAPTLSTSHVTSSMGQGVADAAGHLGKAISNMGQAKANNLQLENMALQNKSLKHDIAGKIQDHYIKEAQFINKLNDPSRNNVMQIAGSNWSQDKGWSDTQKIEDRYGDLISWAYGLGVLGADSYKNATDWFKSLSPKQIKGLEDYWKRFYAR
jgi:hypothetical protein